MYSNEKILNNIYVVSAINTLSPDFVIILGDVTDSGERSEFQRARSILGNLAQKPYVSIVGNHDMWPYHRYVSCINPVGDEASIPNDCYLGEYFYDGFKTMFDSVDLHFTNWTKAPHFSSSPNNKSYYLNAAFDWQNYKFVCVDYNSREGGAWLGVLGDADVNYWSLDWIDNMVDITTNEKRKIFVLGHHPLITRLTPGGYICFTPHEVHQIADEGLLNNDPPAHWIGGHVHGIGCQRIDTTYYGDDTVAFVFTLNNACKDGIYGWVSIYDKLFAQIWHPPYDPDPHSWGLPVTVNFQTLYSYIGSENAFGSANWRFGDGTSSSLTNPTHIYHLWNDLMKTFNVVLTVTAANGRKVSTNKWIKVGASPYSPSIVFAKEDSVKIRWQFDCPQLIDGYMI